MARRRQEVLAQLFDKIFKTTSYLQKGLDAAWKRHEVIANNIANVNTPDFKASSVEFEEHFKAALEAEAGGFKNKQTRAGHMDFGHNIDTLGYSVVRQNNTTQRMDGNNVDIEYEMAELAKNQIYYNTLSRKTTQELTRLRTAIMEGR